MSREKTEEMRRLAQVLIQMFRHVDDGLQTHLDAVASLAYRLSIRLGFNQEAASLMWIAGALHDIGKIAVPRHILTYPGKLTPDEFEIIKGHVNSGVDLLNAHTTTTAKRLARIIGQHHERLDGTGYPNCLVGDAILLESRILSVADVAHAIMSDRPYHQAQGVEVVVQEFKKSGYDPVVVGAFFDMTIMDYTAYDPDIIDEIRSMIAAGSAASFAKRD